MSPILDNQQRLARAGRIRMGERRGNVPVKLDHFRITSASRENLEQVAKIYGGDVTEWNEGSSDDTHQVTITADEIDILIPMSPGSFSDWYESWTAGGLKNRCDGEWDELNDRKCACIPGQRTCKPYTRLNVWLPRVETLGTWLLTSTGYNSNAELGGVVTAIQKAAEALGRPIKATLRLDQRKRVYEGKTRRFPVPVIEAREPVSAIMEAVGGRPAPLPLPERPEQPSLAAPPPADNMTWPKQEPDEVMAEPVEEYGGATVAEVEAMGGKVEPPDEDTSMLTITAHLRQQVMISCREAGIDDDARHDIISHITEGRSQSIKDVREGELNELWKRLTNKLATDTAPLMHEIWPTAVVTYAALHAVEGLEADVKTWGFVQWKLANDHCQRLLAENAEVEA